MARCDRRDDGDIGLVSVFGRTPQLCAGAIAGLGSALWVNVVGPFAGLVAAWGALVLVNALAVVLVAVLAMLVTTAGTLLAADWRADFAGRQGWAEVDLTAPELSLPVPPATATQIDPRYHATIENKVLPRIFRAHRSASVASLPEFATAIHATRFVVASEDAMPAPTTQDAALNQPCNEGGSTAAAFVGMSGRVPETAANVLTAEASNAWASRRKRPLVLRVGHTAAQTWLVANAWSRWPPHDLCVRAQAPRRARTADIIILGNGRDDQSRPLPELSASCAPPTCRGPPRSVVAHRPRAAGTTSATLSAKNAGQPPSAGAPLAADPVVHDNLGQQVPVCAAELDAIETYLDHLLQDLLRSPTAGSEWKQA